MGTDPDFAELARSAWHHLEPVHDVVYFGPGLREHTDAAGLRGFWMAYFAMRAAPLGAADVDLVTAVFFGFHRDRVARSLPAAWQRLSPQQTLDLRLGWVDTALRQVLGDGVATDPGVAEAAELAWAAAQACDCAGRPLGGANRALPRPQAAHLALWQATTTLREHRGDGHNAVLVARGISPAEAHVLKGVAGEADEQILLTGRGFPDAEWLAARARMQERGLLDPAGELTAAGRLEHDEIERATDAAARRPWQALGAERTARLLGLLAPLTDAVLAAGIIPQPSPTGLGGR